MGCKRVRLPSERPYGREAQVPFALCNFSPLRPNTQPWKFAINDDSVSVFADLSRALPFVDPSNRTLFMSVGCAIANLAVAGAHFGFAPSVSYFPEGQESDLVAEVRLLPGGRRPADGQKISSPRYRGATPPRTDMKMRQ
jgi:hypothetical protein